MHIELIWLNNWIHLIWFLAGTPCTACLSTWSRWSGPAGGPRHRRSPCARQKASRSDGVATMCACSTATVRTSCTRVGRTPSSRAVRGARWVVVQVAHVDQFVSNSLESPVWRAIYPNPWCFLQMENLTVTGVDSGVVKCPFHPQANSTSLLQSNGQLFVGTATDFSGSDVAILRTGVESNKVGIWNDHTLRMSNICKKYIKIIT